MDGVAGHPGKEPVLRCESCRQPLRRGDALTGLADRTEFREALERVLGAACIAGDAPASDDPEPGYPGHGGPEHGAAVLLLDLDRFKAVNDSLGHAAGDALLRNVAGRLRATLRPGDLAARLGGDEFAVLLEPSPGENAVSSIAERLVELLSRPYLVEGGVANIGVSIGIAFAVPGIDPEAVLRRADLALYKSKAEGRCRFHFFEPALQASAEARRLLEFDLRAALALGQFELFYQPQLDLASDRLAGFEALIRWRHPVRGLVPPDSFIPLAEELGLIIRIGEWVVREACAEAARWPDGLCVAVNVAAAQFTSGTLISAVTGALLRSGLPSRRLELEVTETALLHDDGGMTLEQLQALKDLGVQVSLDDFGTGYSSLTQLRSFPFDRVKIDRSFADDPAVVRAVAALGNSLGMRITAEGVETDEQMQRLRDDGCTEAQGYLLSRPVPAGEVATLIERLGLLQGRRKMGAEVG
ncbi:putative bifunctional diguanylate cyclase/phosphodiesterase [Roseomonas elaeocarpi]|uniref:Bifunctional diguanylate cyclase/phosphodiesterase n=1 Tax=Roseomonas elaeocarpi TaxID=907779 RepID=A0ABV6JNV4_9PROT